MVREEQTGRQDATRQGDSEEEYPGPRTLPGNHRNNGEGHTGLPPLPATGS